MQPSACVRGVVLLAGLASAVLPTACGSDSKPDADGGPDDADGGDPDALDCDGRSGSRIRQVLRDHSDGSSQFLRLFDSDLGETCAYSLAQDSSVRCIPLADGTPVAPGAVVYSDPGCTLRIGQLAAAVADPPPTHMQEVVAGGSADGCSAVTYNYQLGNEVAVADDATLYRKDADTCVTFIAGTNPYFEIAAELSPDDLVAGTESWVGQGRIQMRRLDGDDGSRSCDLASFRDLDLETSCQLQYGEDNSIQCLPSSLPIGAFFSEGACGTALPLLVVPGECDTGARHGLEAASTTCAYRRRVRTLGAEYADPYFTMDGTCMQVSPAPGDTAYRLGPAISGTSFSSFSYAYIDSGGDRLQRGDLENGAGLRLRAPDAFGQQWFDGMFDTPCGFEPVGPVGEEVLRCLPSGSSQTPIATVASLFSDAGCTAAVQVAQVDLACFTGSAAPTYARMGTQVFPVTGPPAGPIYRMDGACVEVTDMSLYTIGTEIAPEMFVSGSETTE